MTVQTLSLSTLWGVFRTKVVKRRFVQDVSVLTLANVTGAVLSFIQGIWVARWLGPEQYGVAALVMSYPSLVYTFFDARSAEASVKYMSEFHVRNDQACVLAMCKLGYAVDFAIASLAFLVVVVTASWAAKKIAHSPDTANLIIVYAAAFVPHALVGSSSATLATLGKFTLIAWIDTITVAARVALVLGLVALNWQVAGIVWGNVLAIILNGALYGACAYALIQRTWGVSWLQGTWQALRGRRREILGFLAYNNVYTLLTMIPQQLDILLLGYFRDPTEVGYYRLAKSLSSVVNYLIGPLRSVTYPELARFWGLGDREALRRKVRGLFIQIGLPLGTLAMSGILLIPAILSSLVGPSYLPAITAGQIMVAGSSIWVFGFWLRPVYFAAGRINWYMTAGAFSLVFFLPALPFLARFGGSLGVAWWSFGLNCMAVALVSLRLHAVLSPR